MQLNRTLHFAVHAASGSALALGGLTVGAIPEIAEYWRAWREPLIAAGLILLLASALHRRTAIALENYGVSRRTRQVVIVFYEGNDLEDMTAEHAARLRFEDTGQREAPQFSKQTSMLRALGERVRNLRVGADAACSPQVNAHSLGRRGEIPISLASRLVTNIVAPPETERAFVYFLDRYAAFGKAHGLQIWLAFMPCKTHALEGRFRWTQPPETMSLGVLHQELPSVVAEQCSRHGIRFIDLTPALVEEGNRTGELLYNHVFDTHLNAHGSKVVAKALAERLSGAYANANGNEQD